LTETAAPAGAGAAVLRSVIASSVS